MVYQMVLFSMILHDPKHISRSRHSLVLNFFKMPKRYDILMGTDARSVGDSHAICYTASLKQRLTVKHKFI